MSARTRLINFRLGLRRSRRAFAEALRALVWPPKPHTGPSTADWHAPPSPGHPSLLCECYPGVQHHHADPIDHKPDCKWLAYQCRTCGGDGCCSTCGGDGVNPEVS